MKEVSEKITERIRKLIRLKESATQIGSEGEAHAAAAAVHRLLMEYNLSLLDLAGENPQNRLTACESDRISYKDAAGNIWKRDLMRVLCEYNYCKMLLYAGTTHMVVIGTEKMRQLSLRSLTTCVKPSDVCPKRSIPGMRKADAVTGEPPKVRRTISGLIWKAAYPVYACSWRIPGRRRRKPAS